MRITPAPPALLLAACLACAPVLVSVDYDPVMLRYYERPDLPGRDAADHRRLAEPPQRAPVAGTAASNHITCRPASAPLSSQRTGGAARRRVSRPTRCR